MMLINFTLKLLILKFTSLSSVKSSLILLTSHNAEEFLLTMSKLNRTPNKKAISALDFLDSKDEKQDEEDFKKIMEEDDSYTSLHRRFASIILVVKDNSDPIYIYRVGMKYCITGDNCGENDELQSFKSTKEYINELKDITSIQLILLDDPKTFNILYSTE